MQHPGCGCWGGQGTLLGVGGCGGRLGSMKSHPGDRHPAPLCPPGRQRGPQPRNLLLLSSCSCAPGKGRVFWKIGVSVEKHLGRSTYGKRVLLLTGWGQVALHSLVMTVPALVPCNSSAIFIIALSYGADIVQDNMFLPLLSKRVTSTEKWKPVFWFMILLLSCRVYNVCYCTLEINFSVVFNHVQLGVAHCITVNAEFRMWCKCWIEKSILP